MSVMQKLDFCPRETGCASQSVWKDPDTGELYSLDIYDKKDRGAQIAPKFIPHTCTTKAVEAPTTVYTGFWWNSRTLFTRIVGPTRLKRSALRPPPDQTNKKEWYLIKLLEGTIEWKDSDIPDEYLKNIQLKKDLSNES